MEHFHTLKPVVMPRDDYIDEHRRLVKALESNDPGLLKEELKEQKADLDKAVKGGSKEDKRYINSKTPWSLAHLEMKVLREFYNDPTVPPSMKTKLKEAMKIKPGLKLKGGLKGVSKASGFIRRLMWENKNKHKWNYGNPTWELPVGSKMDKRAKFELKKLASEAQGGLNKGAYGASPFITHHFSGTRKGKAKTAPETAAQKKARAALAQKSAEGVTAETVIPTHPALLEHFASQPKPEPKEPKVEPKAKPKSYLPFIYDTKGKEQRWRQIDAETDFYGTGEEAAEYIKQIIKERKAKGGGVPPMRGV
jgi:hypothetical protein